MRTLLRRLVPLAVMALLVVACGGGSETEPSTPSPSPSPSPAPDPAPTPDPTPDPEPEEPPAGALEGAGASFPNPLFVDWIFEYQNDVNPGATINYQSIGSGGGETQFIEQLIDFGSSERYLRDDRLAEANAARGCDAIQFPVVFGAVAIAFGDPALDELILSGEVIADIYERRITHFDDPAIAELNPDRDLPSTEIIPVHRSDSSGTTSVFTTYLDQDTDSWTLGAGSTVQWPGAPLRGGDGNDGVAAAITQAGPGGLGYVNQAYALVQGLPQARVVNADGNAILPTLEATTAAAEVAEIPEDFRFDITGIGGEGYPIAGTNWILVWECGYDEETAALLKHFWTWALTEGDDLALELNYAPMGGGLKDRVLAAIDRINSQG